MEVRRQLHADLSARGRAHLVSSVPGAEDSVYGRVLGEVIEERICHSSRSNFAGEC